MSDEGRPPHARREDPEALLDDINDPGGVAFGASGAEASSDLNWIALLRHRVHARALGSSKYQWWVLWSLLSGLLALNFTFTVFNVDLSHVSTELHTSIAVLLWTSLGPTLAYGIAAPIFGKIGDLFGHRQLYMFGLIGAMISAILTALAPNTTWLILARTLDGIQGAATGTASGALINLVFSREERVKAMGWWSLVGAGGPVVGLSVGAPIIQAWGWRALFWVQLGLLAAAFTVVSILLPQMRSEVKDELQRREKARRLLRRMDWASSWALSLGITAMTLGLSFGGRSVAWSSPIEYTLWAVAVTFVTVFVVRIRTVDNPLIPPKYFKRRNFVWPMIVRAMASFSYFGGFFLTPLILEHCFHASTSSAGFYSMARPIVFAVFSPIAGYAAIRFGERTTATAGCLFLMSSMIAFAMLQPSSGMWLVIVALALSGLGMGVAMPASGSTMANEVDASEFGVMSAAQLLSGQIGQVVGQTVVVSVQTTLLRDHGISDKFSGPWPISTFRLPFLLGAGTALLAAIGSTFYRSLDRRRSHGDLAQPLDH